VLELQAITDELKLETLVFVKCFSCGSKMLAAMENACE